MQQLTAVMPGRYRVLNHLKRGGMADIYLAHDAENGEKVAIKVVHNSNDDYCERFKREVYAMSLLKHKHILSVLDYGEAGDWCYMVMPYMEEGTLSELLEERQLTQPEIETILGQLVNALDYAHEQGVVHRDIKPSNVLVDSEGQVYLADFGLVKRVGDDYSLTVTGFLIGTPEYMAPELAEEDATRCSDVYALGVLLYQMVTGRVPFKASTPMAVYLKHIRDVPPAPSSICSGISTEVEWVILKALEKDPHKRYQSAGELYQAYMQAVQVKKTRLFLLTQQLTHVLQGGRGRADVKTVPQGLFVPARLGAVAALTLLLVLITPTLLAMTVNETGTSQAAPTSNSISTKPHVPTSVATPGVTPTTTKPGVTQQSVQQQGQQSDEQAQQVNGKSGQGNGNNGQNGKEKGKEKKSKEGD